MTTVFDGRRDAEPGTDVGTDVGEKVTARPPLSAPVAPGRVPLRAPVKPAPPAEPAVAGPAARVVPASPIAPAARAVPITPARGVKVTPKMRAPKMRVPRIGGPTPAEGRTGGPGGPGMPVHDLPVLEAFRGIAALMVVVTHVGFTSGAATNGAWAGWLSRLDFGVALFFLLSGFLLFRPFVQAAYGTRNPIDVRAYLRRRYVRIYPALLVVMAVNFLVSPRARDASGWLWVQTLFLVQNYPADFVNQIDGLVQTWSLVVEVSFYVLLPVLAWLILGPRSSMAAAADRLERDRAPEPVAPGGRTPVSRRAVRDAYQPSAVQRLLGRWGDPVALAAARPGIVLLVLAVIGVIWRIAYSITSDGYARQLLWLPAFMDWFAAGMALAWLRERPQPLPEPLRILAAMPGVCWSLALAGYWMITTNLGGPYGLDGATTSANITKHLTYVVIATLLLIPAVFGDRRAPWRAGATHPIMTWLGRISFGVFLWHPMLMELIRRMLRMEPFTGGFWITLLLTMAASLAAGTLSWTYIEEPLQRRWRNGFGRL